MIDDADLRLNHDFVMAFEALRKRHGHREMHDTALQQVADATGIDYQSMRVARHLRNALAHGDPVNRERLVEHHRLLAAVVDAAADRESAGEAPLAASEPVSGERAYRVHAWQDPRLEAEMLANGFVSVGGGEVGDLGDVTDPEEIQDMLRVSMPDRSPRAIALFVGYWRRFLFDAKVGELVVLPVRDRTVAIGEFVGPYHYLDGVEPRARHRRPVAWARTGIDRERFRSDLLVTLNGQHTVQTFTAPQAARRLRRLAATAHDPGP